MNITKITVKKIETPESRLKGYATLEIAGMFVIGDIRIIQGDDKMFIAMPSRKTSTGEFKDICHPINQECREMLTDAILTEYNNSVE